jgi:peptide/nickel transport system substrate-binding protein
MSNDRPRRFSRRQYVLGGGTAAVAALAGCAGDSTDQSTDGTGTDAGTGGDEQDDTETETETTATESSDSGNAATFRLGQAKSPVHFDPIRLIGVPAHMVMNRVFSKLYTYDEGTNLVPNVATSLPEVSREGTRYVVEITDEARFHNGDPVTAEDVVYSAMAPVREQTGEATNFKMISEASVVDETTVQFDLEYAYAMFPQSLTMKVVPKAVREDDPETFRTEQPIGSGPFEFVDWQENEFVELSRWDDYWGEMPNVDGIEYTPIPEPTTRVTTLKNGESDAIQSVPPKVYPTVQGMDDTTLLEEPAIGYYYVAFNCNEGATTDPRVREAVDSCVDMDSVVEKFIEPAGVRQYSPLPRPLAEEWEMPLDQWESIPHSKDTDRAASLFEEAGVPGDWSATILVPPDDKREQIGVSVANGIKEAGYDAEVVRLDWGTYIDTFDTGNKEDYQMYVLGFSGLPDPDAFVYNLFHTDQIGANNGTYYDDQTVMDRIVQARKSTEREERRRLYADVVTTVLEDRVHLAAYNLKNTFGVKGQVSDFQVHPVSQLNPRMVSGYNNVGVDR